VSALTEEILKKVNKIYGILSTSTPISGSVDVIDRAARLLGIVYGSQGQQILQRASTYDLLAALRYQGSEIDPRAIRTLASTDIVTAYGNLGALQQRATSLDLYAALRYAGSEIDPRSIRTLASTDIVTSLINYPSGTLIDPRSIRALTSTDAITVYGSQSQALQQRATSYEALVTIRQSGSELSTSNPIFDSIVYSGGVIDPRVIRTLTSSDVVTAQQTTRTSLTVMPERQDLTVYGVSVTIGTGGTPVQVGTIAAGSSTKIKIYDFSVVHAVQNSLTYLYYGTSSTPTTRIFGTGQSANITGAAFTLHKSLPNPKVSNNSDEIWLYASVAGTYYVELGYVIE
jgi:hypothetical protein